MMNFDHAYRITGTKTKNQSTAKGAEMSLYTAKKEMIRLVAAGQYTETLTIRRGPRAVAMFSEWTQTVRPVAPCMPQERKCLNEWEGEQARPLAQIHEDMRHNVATR